MNLVSELDLPEFDYSAADFSADRYHQQLAETRQRGWLAKSPLAYPAIEKRDVPSFPIPEHESIHIPGEEELDVRRRVRGLDWR